MFVGVGCTTNEGQRAISQSGAARTLQRSMAIVVPGTREQEANRPLVCLCRHATGAGCEPDKGCPGHRIGTGPLVLVEGSARGMVAHRRIGPSRWIPSMNFPEEWSLFDPRRQRTWPRARVHKHEHKHELGTRGGNSTFPPPTFPRSLSLSLTRSFSLPSSSLLLSPPFFPSSRRTVLLGDR